MSHVFYNVYLGSLQDAIEMTDVDIVVNCTTDIPFFAQNAVQIRVPIVDLPSYSNKLHDIVTNTDIFEIMTAAMLQNKKILVHCHAGMSRSASLMVCFIMYYCKNVNKQDYTLEGIIHFLKSKRPIVFHDGYNFIDTLNRYDI
jgi:tyrosine-protein phosphatase